MAAPTAGQLQTLATQGLADPNGTLAASVGLYWDLYASEPDMTRYLYTRRSLVELRMAETAPRTDVQSDDQSVARSQENAALKRLYDALTMQIQQQSAQRTNRGGIALGALTQTAPIMPPNPYAPDTNDIRYRGSAGDQDWRQDV